jgi:hypothetical protein
MSSYGGKKDDDAENALMKVDRTTVFQEGGLQVINSEVTS